MTILDDFKNALNLESKGFIQCNDYEQYGEVYKKKCNDAIIYINCRVEENTYKGISAHVYFEEIEELVNHFPKTNPYLISNNLTLSLYKLSANSDHIYSINKTANDVVINHNNIPVIASLVNEYLSLCYEPFWEKYSVLQTVNDEIIDKVEQMKLSDYIPFQTPWEKLAIMKVCKNPNYQAYVEWLDSIWAKKGTNEDLSQNETYLAYQELLRKLETC